MMDMDNILIFDTTLRDGEQAPGASMNTQEKLDIAFALERAGVDIIEAGFPVSSEGDFVSVKTVADHIKNSTVCALARSVPRDIEVAAQAVASAKKKRIHVFIATSEIHMKHKLKKNADDVLAMAIAAVKKARQYVDDVEFSAEDASRSDPDFLYRITEQAIAAGANTINIPDTVGYSVPEEYGRLIKGIIDNVPNSNKAVISVHCHDDLGVAVANSLEAIRCGARQVECTINGIGERAGNASMEEIVMALKTRADFFRHQSAINTKEIYRLSRLVSRVTGFTVPPNKAIVGQNAFRHESGIHQDGVLKERSTYEIMTPDDVGFVVTNLVLGKHSGRHAFKQRLHDLGYDLLESDLDHAFERFKKVADKKKEVYDDDLIAIVDDEVLKIQSVWSLSQWRTQTGSGVNPHVEITLLKDQKPVTAESTGDGPVDASYKAIDAITGLVGELLDYSIHSVTRGKDALGEVTVKVQIEGLIVIAKGASTDIVEASAKAYLNAINKVLFQKKSC